MKKSKSKKKKTSVQEATVKKTLQEGKAAIWSAFMPLIMLIIFLAFIVLAPKLGVDPSTLQPELISPIITSFLK
ncbi:hypothetical protein [Neobacillus drentensis]|uniref:hypothetical protein n=1 Tax=Neobacillus drentensis TaxID=220684 RepID=UPI0030008E50